jgi:hypothetical protein
MIDSTRTLDSQQPPQDNQLEELRQAARSTLAWDVELRPESPGKLLGRVQAARRALQQLEQRLAAMPKDSSADPHSRSPVDAALLELRENARLVRTAAVGASTIPRGTVKLPRVVVSGPQEEPRAAALAAVYLRAAAFNFSTESLALFLDELQAEEPLMVEELWSIPNLLKFVLLEFLLETAQQVLNSKDTHSQDADSPARLRAQLASLRAIGLADWTSLIEPLILLDKTLRQDPAQAYANMEFESRDYYRTRIAFIARHSDVTESEVAQHALALAQQAAQQAVEDPRLKNRLIHVGYYLIDDGFDRLASRVGFHAPFAHRTRAFLRKHADDFFITGIQFVTILVFAGAIFPVAPYGSIAACLALALILILPAMQNAVELVNSTVTAIFDPQPLPKLDFSNGISSGCATLVTVPTLLLNEDQVRGLVLDLEARYLANCDPNLHFALLTDLPDSVTQPHDKDFHPLVELAVQLIDDLNRKYKPQSRGGSFLLLHRHRIFNVRQGVWMGWERKRGKLLDLNKLLAHEYDAFPIKAGPLDTLRQIRYILTLDSDTQLPHGSAARLIGAMAHPLNQAIIDPKLRIVTAGYGILQPRIGVTVQSASRSRLAAIYSGQSGLDIYTRAISDAYQDLYREGSFTGKGIYEVAILHAVLDHRFPRNSLLSHDLIEGAYARAGLATDIELIDDYPSHLSAYNKRKHRWVRGDWQIVQWIFSRVPEESGRYVTNPISDISRWKIFDNLRRSLVDPFTFLLFVVGWLIAPGGPLYWTLIVLALLFFPAFVQLAFSLARASIGEGKGAVREAFSGFLQSVLITFLNLAFLPQQALLSVDAILRSLVRRFITGKNLLEWETAAQAEAGSSRRTLVDRYLLLCPVVAIFLALLDYGAHRATPAALVALPILVLWSMATFITRWLNASPREENRRLAPGDEAFLMDHALLIWRYFYEFGGQQHNYLIPDNVEEVGLVEAARVSPTNLGLLLNARQAACELGFLTAPEFADLTQRTLDTIANLEKHRGHLYNWYDTKTLQPLGPRTVSSVDSGNLVASLYALHAGTNALLKQPLLSRNLFTGLIAILQLAKTAQDTPPALAQLAPPAPNAQSQEWIDWLTRHRDPIAASVAQAQPGSGAPWWTAELLHRVDAILALVRDVMPWLLTEFAPLRDNPRLAIDAAASTLSIERAPAFTQALQTNLAAPADAPQSHTPQHALSLKLAAFLAIAGENQTALTNALKRIAANAETSAIETDFKFLVSPKRKLLSIGYDVEAQLLHDSCYDLLASEARIATFLAIARGDLPQQSWFKMGREHAYAFGQFVLFSWTGTMFEYLMPALWMRSYPETLVARTLTACVRIQTSFTRTGRLPWGISESGYALTDDAGHYQYHAFGLPPIALKTDASAGPVISPYSTFLALGIDSVEALRNLRRMASLGWIGSYGYYEAADYATSQTEGVLVREWMAHHQGMSLLAILNLLHEDAMKHWFHANALVQSAELLLHETPVRKAVLKATLKDFPPVPAQ